MFDKEFSSLQHVGIPGTNYRFEVDAFPDPTGSSNEAKDVARIAWDNVYEYASAVSAINNDRRYSAIGRAEQTQPVSKDAFTRLLGAWHNLTTFEQSINSIEAQIIAIPNIGQGNILAHLEDRELRDWWSRQGTQERVDHMKLFQNGDQTSERIALAILRSPIPQADHEKTSFKDTWDKARLAAHPVEAERISLGRQAIEWTSKSLHSVGVVVKQTSGWEGDRILRHGLTLIDGALAPQLSRLGFAKSDVAQMKLRLQEEVRRR